MYCPYCRNQIPDGSVFCGFCGTTFGNGAAANDPYGPADERTVTQAPLGYSYPGQPPMTPPPPPPPRKKTGLIIGIAAGAAVLALLIVLFVLGRNGTIDIPFLREKQESAAVTDDGGEKESRKNDVEVERPSNSGAAVTAAPAVTVAPAVTAAPASEVTPGPTEVPTPVPTAAPSLLSSWTGKGVLVCVEDRAGIWPDTAAKPFVGAAERIGDWADCSVVVVTANGTGGVSAATYLSDCCDEMIRSGDISSRQLENCVMLLMDVSRQEFWFDMRGDAKNVYSEGACTEILQPYLRSGDYETGVIRMLTDGKRSAVTPTPAPAWSGGGYYILPYSDREYVTEAQLSQLTWEECTFARNEIYARHGRKFNNPTIRAYFESQSWYRGTIDPADFTSAYTNAVMNQYELKNIETIRNYENRVYGGSRY